MILKPKVMLHILSDHDRGEGEGDEGDDSLDDVDDDGFAEKWRQSVTSLIDPRPSGRWWALSRPGQTSN